MPPCRCRFDERVMQRVAACALAASRLGAVPARDLVKRQRAAVARRLSRRFPEVYPLLADGSLSLSVVALLKPHLSERCSSELLRASAGLSVVKVRELLAARFPRPDVPSTVRKLPESSGVQVSERDSAQVPLVSDGAHPRAAETAAPAVAPKRSRAANMAGSGRRPDRATRRAVVARDGLRCAWIGEDGERCSATGWLELDHEEPFAKGGGSAAPNVRVLCRAHNRLSAELEFGAETIARTISVRRRGRDRR